MLKREIKRGENQKKRNNSGNKYIDEGKKRGRPTTNVFWVDKIWTLKVNNQDWTAGDVFSFLLRETTKETFVFPPNVPEKVPDVKTIRNILRFPPSEAKQATYRWFHWPKSMEEGLIPWEASRACLDLVAYMGRYQSMDRPTNDLAKVFWRVTQAAPDLPIEDRFFTASLGIPNHGTEAVELYLAFSPWKSIDHQKAYEIRLKELGISEFERLEPGVLKFSVVLDKKEGSHGR